MDVAALQLVGADTQGRDGAVHRLLRQPARLREPLAQAHHPAEGIHHDEIVARGAGNQQAAIVGAKVYRGIGLAVRGGLEGGGFERRCWRRARGRHAASAGVNTRIVLRAAQGRRCAGRAGCAAADGAANAARCRLARFAAPGAARLRPATILGVWTRLRCRRRKRVRHDVYSMPKPARNPPGTCRLSSAAWPAKQVDPS